MAFIDNQIHLFGDDYWDEEYPANVCNNKNGHPDYIISKIYDAYCYGDNSPSVCSYKRSAGHVASLICWSKPAEFEISTKDDLDKDIDYYYLIFCDHSNFNGIPEWEIEIYSTDWSINFEEDSADVSEFCERKLDDFRRDPKLEKLNVVEMRKL